MAAKTKKIVLGQEDPMGSNRIWRVVRLNNMIEPYINTMLTRQEVSDLLARADVDVEIRPEKR